MEIRNLQTFVTAASLLNFTQTARMLGYSQSNVSTQIQQLEEEVGARLFDRIGRSVSLTHQGQELLQYAQQIVSLSDQMENALKPAEELRGTLRIGLCQSVFEATFERTFTLFHEQYPKVRVDATMGSSAALLVQLQKNLIDAACLIDRPLSRREWNCRYRVPARIGMVLRYHHRLADRDVLTMEELKGESFVLMEEDAPYNLMFRPQFPEYDLEEKIKLRMEDCAMAARLVTECDSVSILPEYAVRDMIEAHEIRFIPLEGYNPNMEVQMVTHKSKVLTPQILGFAECFAACMGQIIPEQNDL